MSDLPDVNYLSATLTLSESGNGETRGLHLTPFFDHARMEVTVDGDDGAEEAFIVLNRAQIECLGDFLTAWLGRLATTAPAPSSGPGRARKIRGIV